MTLLAYRYALDPTPRQERALRSHAGATGGRAWLAEQVADWQRFRDGIDRLVTPSRETSQ